MFNEVWNSLEIGRISSIHIPEIRQIRKKYTKVRVIKNMEWIGKIEKDMCK